MKPWYQIAIPREDILQGNLDDALFAADLADVLADRGPLEYRDPLRFFQQTYPTMGLVKLLAAAAQRLANGTGDSVIQLQTPFGGGKTHALISLYHLFASGAQHSKQPLVQRTLEQAGLGELPSVRVVSFIGTEADALQGRTPWGEIAHQLGAYSLLEEHDKRRRAPGRELLYELIAKQPTLILMDELVTYAVAAKDFDEQLMVFCQNLTEAVSSSPRSMLVATLPSSAPYGEIGERLLHQLEQIFGRVQAIYTPVEGDEFFDVIRQRLFKEIADPPEARRVVDAYFELYQRQGETLPDEVRSEAYRERMRRAYPFHPEIIDTLYNRWSTYSTFQRTRGVLKFLASVLSDLYARQVSAPLILPVHLNLRNAALRGELIRHIGNQYEGVVHQDIAGDSAQAEQIDKQLGSEYAPYRVASGLATAIFFESFSAGERVGVTEPRLRLAALQPNLPHAVIGDALHKLSNQLWYLHVENGAYAFRLQPNLNRIILDKEERVSAQEIEQALQKSVQQVAGNALGATVLFPERASDIPDQKHLRLVILAPRYTHGSEATDALARELLERYGQQPRVYRNCLMVLAADPTETAQLQTRLKQKLALEAIKNDRTLWKSLSDEDKAEVERRIQMHSDGIASLALSAYRHLALMRERGVEWSNLGIPTAGERRTLSERVRHYLKNEDILLDRLSPRLVLEKAVGNADEKPVKDIVDAFYRYPQLPMVESDSVILDALARGVQEGLFGIRSGEREYYKELIPPAALEYDAMLVREVGIREEGLGIREERLGIETPIPNTQSLTPNAQSLTPTPQPLTPNSYRRYALRAAISSAKASEFVQGVIAQIMRQAGAEFRFTVEFEVKGELPRNLVDIAIHETLKQIGAQVDHEQKE